MDQKAKHKLKKFVHMLSQVRGRHTELVSVYVPAGYDIVKIIQHLQQEQDTAGNIKDKTNRKNVIDALEKMIRHLRLYKALPVNGLATFSGNFSKEEGKPDIQIHSIEPPAPLNIRLYRCDQSFKLEALLEMLVCNDAYALIAMDNREATIGILNGKRIQVLKQMHSGVPGKFKAGGQSQQRFARLREEAAHDFYKRIGDFTNNQFLPMGNDLKGLIIGGPGMTKEKFASGNYLNNEIKKKTFTPIDLSYTNEYGLNSLVEKGQHFLIDDELSREKDIMKEFFSMLGTDPDKIAYGEVDVTKALEYGAVSKLVVSEDFVNNEVYEEKVENTGGEFHLISIDTEEGVQLKNLGGIGAILRFAIAE